MFKWLNNITGLFVGPNSNKRAIGMISGLIVMILWKYGYVDQQMFEAAMLVIGTFTGFAFSAKLSKIARNK